jgi:hypothetical protein
VISASLEQSWTFWLEAVPFFFFDAYATIELPTVQFFEHGINHVLADGKLRIIPPLLLREFQVFAKVIARRKG